MIKTPPKASPMIRNKYQNLPQIVVMYGHVLSRPLYKPVNDFAHDLLTLLRKRNFGRRDIENLMAMGFPVEIKPLLMEDPLQLMQKEQEKEALSKVS